MVVYGYQPDAFPFAQQTLFPIPLHQIPVQYHEPGSTAALKAGMQTSNSTPAAVLSRDRTSDSPSMRTKAWRINCSGKEVHACLLYTSDAADE